ncbi:hypothetical protein ACU4GR_12080 [Methylobacterium oryzae CBMB20]
MTLTFIEPLVAEGQPLRAAIRAGALTRQRPVAMIARVAAPRLRADGARSGTKAEVPRPLATGVIGDPIRGAPVSPAKARSSANRGSILHRAEMFSCRTVLFLRMMLRFPDS